MFRKSRRRTFTVMSLLMAAGALGACSSSETTREAPPRAVRVLEVQPRDTQVANRYSGSLEPRVQADLTFKVGGKVGRLGVAGGEGDGKSQLERSGRTPPVEGKGGRPLQEGDSVRRGQVLAQLEPEDLRLQARAASAAAASAVAQERAAAAALEQAEAEVKRARTLFGSGNIAQAELDRVEGAFASARANLEATQGQRRAKSEQAALAAGAVADTALRSPMDGIIGRRMLEVGESVGPGKPVFTVLDTSEMRTVFGVPDVRVNTLEVGQRVPVSIDALPGRTLVGVISKISPMADPALRSYAVEVAVPNPDGELKTGMVASVELSSDPHKLAMLIPLSAVVRGPEQGFAVYVLKDGRTSSMRPVELGDVFDNAVAVEKGLAAGERVVIEGSQFLRDGSAVEVAP